MKHFTTILFISFLSMIGLSQKQELRAYLDSKQFYAPEIGNYVEFHLQFVGYSLKYIGKDDGLIGEVAVQMKISKNDVVVASDAYRLATPFMKDSIVEDFYDVKRFALEPGDYTFNIELQDLNSENDPLLASQVIIIENLADAISISDILVAEIATKKDENSAFNKSGYTIIPRLSTFYPVQLNTIPVYFEIYNSKMLEDGEFALKQTVINADTEVEMEALTLISRHKVDDVIPIFKKVDISNLLSGKYILNYTLINRNMKELSIQSYVFERSNDEPYDFYTDDLILDPAFQASITDDSVGYYLESLIPISKANEVKNIIKISNSKNAEQARKYIQIYWSKTAPIATYDEWIKYKLQVQLVEKMYANNFQEGYETDRGRVYLQYGSPNEIINREFQTTEYPYQIWRYNKIGSFSNKRFVFYNPDLSNNAYRLLHSDMVGELKNPSWPRDLARRTTTNGNVDDPNRDVQDHYGVKAVDDY